jgi:hypothetical protein
MRETLPKSQILKIEMIQNMNLWKRFFQEKINVMDINNGDSNTKLAWHGTSGTPPASVYQGDQGFNIVYSRDGMWGRALYFAVNASYSCPAYSHPIAAQPGTF